MGGSFQFEVATNHFFEDMVREAANKKILD